jgi:hypothetical protein
MDFGKKTPAYFSLVPWACEIDRSGKSATAGSRK